MLATAKGLRHDRSVTADIPLAADVIAKGGEALNPRGERYSPDNDRGVLANADFMDTMRAAAMSAASAALTQAAQGLSPASGHLDRAPARAA